MGLCPGWGGGGDMRKRGLLRTVRVLGAKKIKTFGRVFILRLYLSSTVLIANKFFSIEGNAGISPNGRAEEIAHFGMVGGAYSTVRIVGGDTVPSACSPYCGIVAWHRLDGGRSLAQSV
jgi:hypothetical protein